MNKCGTGIFTRQTQNYPKSGGPYGASTEINRRLATLFDPFAAAHSCYRNAQQLPSFSSSGMGDCSYF
ncbi:hypothetical protein ACHAP8_010779 [Fusarium lateritium]